MTAALAQAEIDRNHYRRALEAVLRDFQFIADALAAARLRLNRRDEARARAELQRAHSHTGNALYRVRKALQWEPGE